MFHHTCFEYIKSQYKHVTDWIVWSDNCSGQYKCQQNFVRIAEAPAGGRSVSHRFAMVGQFKGPHDGAGKVFKWKYKSLELQNIRSPNPVECFNVMQKHFSEKPDKQDWMELKANNDPKLLKKKSFEHTSRKV